MLPFTAELSMVKGNAAGNEVIIESGTITGMVFGGSAAENGYTEGNKDKQVNRR